jgi:hypothetical protein
MKFVFGLLIIAVSHVFVSAKATAHISATFLKKGLHNYPLDGMFGIKQSNMDDVYVGFEMAQFKAYRPKLFELLRLSAGVANEKYKDCLNSEKLECLSADSKSGQAFWRSSDGIIVVKTIRQYECRNMRTMLKSYSEHVLHDDSCIARILGLYRVKLKGGKKTYFLVSKNVYKQSDAQTNMTRTYDLKGSTVGRLKSPTSTVLKDLDLLNSRHQLQLGRAKSVLLRTLGRDVEFLRGQGFMDYSLLVQEEATAKEGFRRFLHRVLNPRVPQPVIDKCSFPLFLLILNLLISAAVSEAS